MSGINAFSESMAANGLLCPDDIIPDGKIHRFNVNGDKSGSKNGFYILYGDGLPAGSYGSWKTGETFTWCGKSEKSLTDAERAKYRERIAKAKAAKDKEQKHLRAKARKKAAWIWENSKPVIEHPYLQAKGVKSHGLRLYKGSLVVPIRDVDGIIRGVQFISADGSKNFLTGSAIANHFYPIDGDGDGDGDTLLICEGYSTGASLRRVTGYPVVVAFNAGNLKAVTEVLHKKSPGTNIIICGEDDFQTDGNPGITEAKEAAAAVGAILAIPKFKDQARRGTDFNDLHQLEGLEAVRLQIKDALEIPPASQDKTIAHLASLSPFEYEQQRVSMADKLGVRVSILDQEVEKIRKENNPEKTKSLVEELDPWPDLVTGAELLNTIFQTVKEYMVIPDESAVVCALWTVLSYAYNNFVCVPILAVQSPVKRCGKSRLITGVLNALCYRALSASNVTGPTVFRVIEKYHPCLVLDEGDTYMPEDECLRGIINSGHIRQTAFVLRCNINTLEPECFSTWCPKIIGGIGRLPDTLQDRAVAIDLKRKLATESTKRLTLNFNDECLHSRRKCLRWCQDHEHELKHANPQLPQIDNDRALDNWTPLLAIADLVGGSWPEKARSAMMKFEGQKDDDNIRIILLQDIKKVFDERGCPRLWTHNLIEALVAMEDRPWCEWKKGKDITPVGLAKMLKPFGVTSIQIRQNDKNKKGYEFKQFEDIFDRYIPSPLTPNQNATTLQSFNHASSEENQSATKGVNVADRKRLKPAPIAKCSVVAFQNGDTGEEDIKAPDSITKPEQEVIDLW
jgi:putative DNA primase/helicase